MYEGIKTGYKVFIAKAEEGMFLAPTIYEKIDLILI
jgi:hypothetical protein